MSTPSPSIFDTTYVKLFAASLLGLTYLGALAVEGIELLNNQQPPSIVTFVIGTGVSTALTVLGIHIGASTGGTTNASTSTP